MRTSTTTSSRTTTTRASTRLLSRVAAIAAVVALTQAALAGPSRGCDAPRKDRDRHAHVYDGFDGRYGRGYHRERKRCAGTLVIDGRRFHVGASSPYKRAARAFRRAGYDARVRSCSGRRFVHVHGSPCVRWRGDLYAGSYRARHSCGEFRLAYRRGCR